MGRGNKGNSSGFNQKSVDELIAEYRKMVKAGKIFVPFAANNLEHWLGNTGTKRVVRADPFRNEAAVVNHLEKKHRAIFLSTHDLSKGLVPRITKNPGEAQYSMSWEDSTYATPFTELFFALGGFTVRSKVEVHVKPDANDPKLYHVQFTSWQSQAFDDYNWDHGKSVNIPGWGKIDDKDALRVEKAGKAKSYLIESDWWVVNNAPVVAPAKIRIEAPPSQVPTTGNAGR